MFVISAAWKDKQLCFFPKYCLFILFDVSLYYLYLYYATSEQLKHKFVTSTSETWKTLGPPSLSTGKFCSMLKIFLILMESQLISSSQPKLLIVRNRMRMGNTKQAHDTWTKSLSPREENNTSSAIDWSHSPNVSNYTITTHVLFR